MDKNLQTFLKICSVFGVYTHLETSNCFGRNCSPHIFRIYIVLLMAIQLFNCIFGIIKYKISSGYIISWAVSTSVFISQMFTHFIIMYETLAKHQEHMDFMRALQDIGDYFKIFLKVDVKKSTLFKEIHSNLIVLNIISKICLITFTSIVLIYSDGGYFWWALLAIFAMRFRFIQMITYVEILKHYMLTLNKKLNQVVYLKMEKSKQLLDIDYGHLESIEFIRNIKHIYTSLYEASTLMNEFAQASMFAASASFCLDITCHLYWILLAMENLLSPYNIIASIATILPLSVFVFRFCYICQLIKDENQRTALLLMRLLSCDFCPLTKKNYKNFVHDFCMQLMHQRIEFTGNRFFSFDLKCIFGICALIATHLIILIQFTKRDSNLSLNKAT